MKSVYYLFCLIGLLLSTISRVEGICKCFINESSASSIVFGIQVNLYGNKYFDCEEYDCLVGILMVANRDTINSGFQRSAYIL